MAHVLFVWELGLGFGHVAGISSLLRDLCDRGHRVTAAVVNPDAGRAFLPTGVTVLPLPVPPGGPPARPLPILLTYPHLLYQNGFDSVDGLAARARVWRAFFESLRPDLILFDHSPTAVVGASGVEAARVRVGTGFFCPPEEVPMPNLRPWVNANVAGLAADERYVLGVVNGTLDRLGRPPASSLGHFFADFDETILRTFPELDHYPGRQAGRYWGTPTAFGGEPLRWRSGRAPRVFAYLKPSPNLVAVATAVAQTGADLHLFASGLSSTDKAELTAAGVAVSDRPVDTRAAGESCDLALLNGTHATTVAMLLAGKPVVQLPFQLEQLLLSLRVEALGGGVVVSPKDPTGAAQAVLKVSTDPKYRVAAERFATAHRGFDPAASAHRLGDHLDCLLIYRPYT